MLQTPLSSSKDEVLAELSKLLFSVLWTRVFPIWFSHGVVQSAVHNTEVWKEFRLSLRVYAAALRLEVNWLVCLLKGEWLQGLGH